MAAFYLKRYFSLVKWRSVLHVTGSFVKTALQAKYLDVDLPISSFHVAFSIQPSPLQSSWREEPMPPWSSDKFKDWVCKSSTNSNIDNPAACPRAPNPSVRACSMLGHAAEGHQHLAPAITKPPCTQHLRQTFHCHRAHHNGLSAFPIKKRCLPCLKHSAPKAGS